MSDELKALIQRYTEEIFHKGNLNAIEEFIAPTYSVIRATSVKGGTMSTVPRGSDNRLPRFAPLSQTPISPWRTASASCSNSGPYLLDERNADR